MPGKGDEITTKFKVDISDLKKGITEANRNIKLANAEFKAASAGMDNWAKSNEGINAKLKQLASVLQSENKKLESYKKQLQEIEKAESENGKRADELKTKLQQLASQGVSKTSDEYKKYEKALSEVEKEQQANKTAADNLKVTILNQQAAVNKTEKDIRNYTTALDQLEAESDEADSATDDLSESIEEVGEESDKAESKVGKLAKGLAKSLVAGAAAAAAGLVALTKSAITNFAEYEQLVGGVDTLFKDSSSKVQKYADNAYKTAGISANQYMETVTSFSASLLQSLGGDTEKAADVADMALTDMADNANKMGTAMSSIQDAYQGFAKQNYTMLDNLKLGYGGTKTEMERLLADAQKITGIEYDISNLNDVYQAIHVIQGELGITGTTALEASTTIQGSAAAMKSAWSNLMTGLADDNADMEVLISNFIDSVGTFASNLIPRIAEVMSSIGGIIREHLPEIAAQIRTWVSGLLDDLIAGLPDGFKELATAIKDGLGVALDVVTELFKWIIDNGDVVISLLAGIAAGFLAFKVASIIQAVTTALQGMTVAQWLLNAAMSANPIGLVALAIGALITAITMLILNWDKVKEATVKCWEGIKTVVDVVVDWIKENWQTMILFLMSPMAGLFKYFYDHFEGFRNFVDGFVQSIKDFFSNLWEGIKGIFSGAGDWFGEKFSDAKDKMATAWSGLKEWASTAWSNIKSGFANVDTWFKSTFSKAWSNVKNVFSNWGSFFGNLWTTIKDKFSSIGTNISNAISGAVKSGINGVISSIEKIINKAIGLINGAIGVINKLPGVSVGTIGTVSFPRLQKGGILKKGQVGLLEGNGAEAVVPLDRNKYWIKNVAKEMQRQLATDVNSANTINNSNVNNFTQVINAPKSPSRIELYRQTKNLLELKGV